VCVCVCVCVCVRASEYVVYDRCRYGMCVDFGGENFFPYSIFGGNVHELSSKNMYVGVFCHQRSAQVCRPKV